jgi:putative lipoprotein
MLSSAARAEDAWFARDKGLHFGVSAGLAAGGYGVSAVWLEPRWARATAGFASAFGLGLAKEAWDATGRGDPSGRDVAWDAIGALTGTAVAWGIDLAFQHRRSRSAAWSAGVVRF